MLCGCLTPVSKYNGQILVQFLSLQKKKLPEFVAAFVKMMSLLQTSKGALDSSYFFKCLMQIISKPQNLAFQSILQQDAAEILSYILELCGESIHASESIRIHIKQTILSKACQQYTSTEDSPSILLSRGCWFKFKSITR